MIPFRTTRVDNEQEEQLATSKLFGRPVFPKRFLGKNKLKYDYYFAQINLDELAGYDTPLPKTGMLYFFLHFAHTSIHPRVVYTDRPLHEVMDDCNEEFDELYFADALQLTFGEGDHGYLLDGFDQEVPEADHEDYVVILKVVPLNVGVSDFPIFFNPDDELYFFIEPKDLAKLRFDRVKLVGHGS